MIITQLKHSCAYTLLLHTPIVACKSSCYTHPQLRAHHPVTHIHICAHILLLNTPIVARTFSCYTHPQLRAHPPVTHTHSCAHIVLLNTPLVARISSCYTHPQLRAHPHITHTHSSRYCDIDTQQHVSLFSKSVKWIFSRMTEIIVHLFFYFDILNKSFHHFFQHHYNVPGSRFQVPGSRFQVPGTRFQVPGSKLHVSGSSFQVAWQHAPSRGFLPVSILLYSDFPQSSVFN